MKGSGSVRTGGAAHDGTQYMVEDTDRFHAVGSIKSVSGLNGVMPVESIG